MLDLPDTYDFSEIAVDSDDEDGRSYAEVYGSSTTGMVYLYAEDEGPKPVVIALSPDEARDLINTLETALSVADAAVVVIDGETGG